MRNLLVSSLTFYLLLICCSNLMNAQITGKQAVQEMHKGINIGNTLDAPSGETTWGNPVIEEYYFDDYKDQGFTAIRIPVTWGKRTQETSPFTIEKTFLDRVEQVVDWGLARGLYIIVNAHHEGWVKNSKECIAGNQCGTTQQNQDRLNAIWAQVSQRMKDKSYKLLFEILNEPETMTLANLNILQARITKTIRSSGGSNGKRIIVFAGTQWSASDQLVKVDIPESDHTYLIGNFHQYSPYNFVTDTSKTMKWGSTTDKNGVKALFDIPKTWATSHDVAVMINEWGCGFDTHDYNSVMDLYQYYVQSAAHYNFAPFVWDDGGNFKTYERKARTWHGDLIDILTNPMLSKNGMKAIGYYDASGVSRQSSGSGYYVGNIATGNFVTYRIEIPRSGKYVIELEVQSSSNTGVISVQNQGGSTVYSLVNVPNTSGQWVKVKSTISLNSGLQNLVLAAKVGGYNLKTIKLTKANNSVNVTGITIQKSVTIGINGKVQAVFSVLPVDASNTNVVWKSDNTNVLTVDSHGLLSGKSEGTAKVTVTTVEGKFSALCTVTVKKIAVSGVVISQKSISVGVGQTTQISQIVSPLDATNRDVTFKSSNIGIATVNQLGIVKGVTLGTATISVTTSDGGFTSSSTITVTKPVCPEWQQGINYLIGTVVTYKGINYTSTNDWNSSAGDPYSATHSTSGWGWKVGGECNSLGFIESMLQRI